MLWGEFCCDLTLGVCAGLSCEFWVDIWEFVRWV